MRSYRIGIATLVSLASGIPWQDTTNMLSPARIPRGEDTCLLRRQLRGSTSNMMATSQMRLTRYLPSDRFTPTFLPWNGFGTRHENSGIWVGAREIPCPWTTKDFSNLL